MNTTCQRCNREDQLKQARRGGKLLCKPCRIYVVEGPEAMLAYLDEKAFAALKSDA